MSIAASSSPQRRGTQLTLFHILIPLTIAASILLASCVGGQAGLNQVTFLNDKNWVARLSLPTAGSVASTASEASASSDASAAALAALPQTLAEQGVQANLDQAGMSLAGSGGPLQLRKLIYGALKDSLDPFAGGTSLTLSGAVQAGQTLSLTLEAIPSSGFSWQVESLGPAQLSVASEPQFQQVSTMPGAPEHQIVAIQALQAGQASLHLAYRRPWIADSGPQRTLNIEAPRLESLADLSNPNVLPASLELEAPLAQDVVTPPADQMPTAQDLPAAFDWRAQGKTPPVRSQGSCGSCWAFATVGALESAIMIKDDVQNIDISEQYLISCNNDGWSCYGGGTAHPYHMGTASKDGQAGAVLEAAFPYVGKDVACGGPYNHPYKISGWEYIDYDAENITAIKQAILTRGPVKASVCVGSAFQAYRSGVFSTNETGACGGGSNTNHAIVLVGWDDSQGPNGVWILRNSWGASWGESGYMRIDRTVSNVGTYASYVVYNGVGPVVPNASQNKRVFLPMVKH